MASAFLVLTSLKIRTASAGEARIQDMTVRGEYALEHRIRSGHEPLQRLHLDWLRYVPNREQRHIEASKTFPDLGERRTDGDFVVVFAGADGPIRGVAGEKDFLVRAMEVIYDPR